MRVIVIQPTADKRGHYGLYTTRLCQALADRGHAVTLCTNHLDPALFLREVPRFEIVEVGGGALAFAPFDAAARRRRWVYYWGYLRNCYRISAAAAALCTHQSFDAGVIMDTEFLIASLVLRRARRVVPPLVMALWASNFAFSAYAGPPVARGYKVVQREVFKTALGDPIRALAVLGEWHRDRLRAQLELPARFPVAVIPDGGDPSVELPDRAAARARLSLPPAGDMFLFFGILRREKGLACLLEAMAALPPGPHLLVAGWPMEYTAREIEELVRRFGVADRVVLRLSYVPEADVPWYFAASDALVLPYTAAYAGGSGPLIKGACTYRRPVVATDVSEMGRLVRTHGLGLLARPDDPASLGTRLQEFLALDDNERARMRQQAATVAAANSWEQMAARFTDVLAQIAAPTPPRGRETEAL